MAFSSLTLLVGRQKGHQTLDQKPQLVITVSEQWITGAVQVPLRLYSIMPQREALFLPVLLFHHVNAAYILYMPDVCHNQSLNISVDTE